MSERTMWLGMTSAIVLLVFSGGSLLGNRHGRAEQKRWDDAWYQAHPVVKEVNSPFISTIHFGECAFIMQGGMEFYYLREAFDSCWPAPPKKAKPAKMRKRAYWESDGPTRTITLPANTGKALCSFPLNQGTATVYWNPRADGQCYSADMPGFTAPASKP